MFHLMNTRWMTRSVLMTALLMCIGVLNAADLDPKAIAIQLPKDIKWVSNPNAGAEAAVSWTLPGRLWRNPQNVWARRALFQIHLWAGVGAGIYILLISVSGSVIVFRNELYKSFVRPPLVVEPFGTPLTDDELKAA